MRFMILGLLTLFLSEAKAKAEGWAGDVSVAQIQIDLTGKLTNTNLYNMNGVINVSETLQGLTASLSKEINEGVFLSGRWSGFANSGNEINRNDISIFLTKPMKEYSVSVGYYFNDTEIGGNFVTTTSGSGSSRIQIESTGIFSSIQKTFAHSDKFLSSVTAGILFGDYDMYFGTDEAGANSSDTNGMSADYSLIQTRKSGGFFRYSLGFRQLEYDGPSESRADEDNFILSVGASF